MASELTWPGAIVDARLHAPVGLAIGAETPEEIALAIVAEVQSVLTRSTAASLRDRIGPIHGDATAASPAEAE
jgi:xanthine/CO dehydrogenase XdhC/CoxF family maturation factor